MASPLTSQSLPQQDIYAEPKLLKKKRKRDSALDDPDIWKSSKELSTSEIISRIVPIKINHFDQNLDSKLTGRHIAFHRSAQSVIEQDPRNKRNLNKTSNKNPKNSSSSETRRARYIALENLIKQEEVSYKYERFVPLHELWLGYMQELLGLPLNTSHGLTGSTTASKTVITTIDRNGLASLPPAAVMQAKLLKADYSGALFTVKRAKNPSLVGLTGIMIQESQETFKLITSLNQIKLIPKPHCVFEFKLPLKNHSSSSTITSIDSSGEKRELVFEIFGNMFMFRSTDRVSRKFKYKANGEL